MVYDEVSEGIMIEGNMTINGVLKAREIKVSKLIFSSENNFSGVAVINKF
ncbi:MAG: hypothetical protein N3A71_03870 [Candidatus Dojkabacteria bacterium]|nr:hypothetical protein [Candidatus Dojkabacteria bacterium]